MGFAEQLQEIIARLPDCHQTVLFSATLPKLLVEFARAGEERGGRGVGTPATGCPCARRWGWCQWRVPRRAGLTEPMLIRLDVESKLSEQLKVRGAGAGGAQEGDPAVAPGWRGSGSGGHSA